MIICQKKPLWHINQSTFVTNISLKFPDLGGGGNCCRRPTFPPSILSVLTLLFSLSLFLWFSFAFPATFNLISSSSIAGHNLSPSDGGRTWLIILLAQIQQNPRNLTSEALANMLLYEPVNTLHHHDYFSDLSLRVLSRSQLRNREIWPRLYSKKILPADFQRLSGSFLKLCYRFLQICRSEIVFQVTITSGMAGHSHPINTRGRTLTVSILLVRVCARTIPAFGNIFSTLVEAVKFNPHLSLTNSFEVSSTFLDNMLFPVASTQEKVYFKNLLGLIPKQEYFDQDASLSQMIYSPTVSFFFTIYHWRTKRKASLVDLSLSSNFNLCPSKTGNLVIKRQTGIMSPSRLRGSSNLIGSLSGWPATEHNLQTAKAARSSGVQLGFPLGKIMGLNPLLSFSGPYWTDETFSGSHIKVKHYICLIKILKISSKPYSLDWSILNRTFNYVFKNFVVVNHRTWIRSWLPLLM